MEIKIFCIISSTKGGCVCAVSLIFAKEKIDLISNTNTDGEVFIQMITKRFGIFYTFKH